MFGFIFGSEDKDRRTRAMSNSEQDHAVNGLSDFAENSVVPLLEQYVSADAAARARSAIEDMSASLAQYRSSFFGGKPTGNGVGGAANRYRTALYGETKETEQIYQKELHNKRLKKFALKKKPTALVGDPTRFQEQSSQAGGTKKVNSVADVDQKVNSSRSQKGFSMSIPKPAKSVETSEHSSSGVGMAAQRSQPPMVGIAMLNKDVVATREFPLPVLTKSGQVLIKVQAVGLNHYDYKRIQSGFASRIADAMSTISKSVVSPQPEDMRRTSASSTYTSTTAENQKLELIGVEFCGTIENIVWERGELLHDLHVARHDMVYGVLKVAPASAQNKAMKGKRQEEGFSFGALSQYLVCDANDVVKVPSGLAPEKAAALALDGSEVARVLAEFDFVKGTKVVILGATTNAGLMLLELLLNDLKVPDGNIFCAAVGDQLTLLEETGIPEYNLIDMNSPDLQDCMMDEDKQIDAVFDCLAETDKKSDPGYKTFHKILTMKLKETGRILALDTVKVMAEKVARNDNYLREMTLLNQLVKEKKLALELFSNPSNSSKDTKAVGSCRVFDFNTNEVAEGLHILQTGRMVGKAVVSVTANALADLAGTLEVELA